MLTIPTALLKEFKGRYDTHRMNIAAMNIYMQMAKLIAKNPKYLDRDLYQEVFLDTLSDIELVSPPTDAFIPGEKGNGLFDVNRLAAEYIEITSRVPIGLFMETLGPTSALTIMLKEHPEEMDSVYDDLYRFYCLFKYIDMIDMIRLNTFSNYTPIIEYIVKNITLNDWTMYLSNDPPIEDWVEYLNTHDPIDSKAKKINQKFKKVQEKYAEIFEDLLFNPDMASVQKFYMHMKDDVPESVPKFNALYLLQRLSNNTVLKTDPILLLGVYLIISYSMKDYANTNVEPSEGVKYVNEVLSVL